MSEPRTGGNGTWTIKLGGTEGRVLKETSEKRDTFWVQIKKLVQGNHPGIFNEDPSKWGFIAIAAYIDP